MRESPPARGRQRAALVLSFSSFFVFPALPIGRTTGLAIPYVLATLLSILWLGRTRRSEWLPLALMMAPLVLSASYVLGIGAALAPDVVPKLVAVLAISFVIVVPIRYLFRTGYGGPVVLGAALAIIVQAVLGAYQYFAYERNEYPFADIMNTNPGMAMSPSAMETYALYVRRPFGLFAEPSAMAACLGPWLVLISVALFSEHVHPRFRERRTVLLAALVSGLSLVVLSRSGQAVPIALGAAAPAILAAFKSRRRAIVRWATLLVGMAIVGGASTWLATRAAARFSLSDNESWQMRLASLKTALSYIAYDANVLFGVGPGQSAVQLGTATIGGYSGGGVTAVWSVTLAYAMETGFIGVASMLTVCVLIGRAIWMSRGRIEGVACGGVWLVGVLVGTSYSQQPALWSAMAALLSWREIASDRSSVRGTRSRVSEFGTRSSPLAQNIQGPRTQ